MPGSVHAERRREDGCVEVIVEDFEREEAFEFLCRRSHESESGLSSLKGRKPHLDEPLCLLLAECFKLKGLNERGKVKGVDFDLDGLDSGRSCGSRRSPRGTFAITEHVPEYFSTRLND